MKSNSRGGSKLLDAKVFIAALAILVTLGFWNLFSNPNLLAVKTVTPQVQDPPTQQKSNDGQGFPPLPTLSPLVEVTIDQPVKAASGNGPQPAGQAAPLRAVTAPDQTIVQKVKPVVEIPSAPVVVTSGGSNHSASSSGSASSAPAPVTSTGSSKK